MSIIGTKIVLWKEEFSLSAYVDQMGVAQKGYIVTEEYPVTIIETKKVKGMWGNSEYDGWKAITEDGRVFTCNWDSFPDDSMTPTYYWDVVKENNGELWQPVDAIQSVRYFPCVDVNGNRKMPVNSKTCEKHNEVYLLSENCWKCQHGI